MRPAARLAAAVLAAVLLLGGPGPALAEDARPTADPPGTHPTAPVPGGPPQGSGPGGATVGGEGLDTRGTVVTDGAPPLPAGVVAPGWLVADAGSGAVLAALLLNWGSAVPAGTAGMGRLVDSAADVPPPQTPAARPPALVEPALVPIPLAGDGEPLLPVGLAVTAAGVVAATVVGVRRAIRVAPAPVRSSGRPRTGPPGPPPRAPRGRPPAPGAGSPSTRP